MPDSPWSRVEWQPGSALSALRFSEGIVWDLYWAVDAEDHRLLVLRHHEGSSPAGPLPRFRGVDAILTPTDNYGHRLLILRLLDRSFEDIFLHLCEDIAGAMEAAETEPSAVAIALARTWRWHHLLRGGASGLLSAEEQKGLLGELLLLERTLVPAITWTQAVESWLGPIGGPKDFEINRIGIESKVRRGGGKPYVSISSEHQLDCTGLDRLFLNVAEVDRSTRETKESFTLTDVVRRLQSDAATVAGDAVLPLELALSAAGFRWEDDYSDYVWVEGSSHQFEVVEGFPSISATWVPFGVSRVTYEVSLVTCEAFKVEPDTLDQAIKGGFR